jgi:uncharacterized protein YgiM (DUF1202 family)
MIKKSKKIKSRLIVFISSFAVIIIFGYLIFLLVSNLLKANTFEISTSGQDQDQEFQEEQTLDKLISQDKQSQESEKNNSSSQQATTTPEKNLGQIVIQETETGWLNVRQEPSTNSEIITKIYPKQTFVLLEEKDNWYKIKLENNKEGWISSKYAKKQ